MTLATRIVRRLGVPVLAALLAPLPYAGTAQAGAAQALPAKALGSSGVGAATQSGHPGAPSASTAAPTDQGAGSASGTGRADYVIRARLDDTEDGAKSLVGDLVLTWTNASRDAVSDLWFHLYHNAFASNRSTQMVEAGGRGRRGARIHDGWGWQRVTAISARGTDLLPTMKWRGDEGSREEDRTVFSVELGEPVPPGGSVEVLIEWEALVPRVRRRTGYKADFLLMAHWFPKLGVYESGRGWNCHTFHANTEFFADYGSYDVTLDLPGHYEATGNDVKVGASGVEVMPSGKADGRVTKRFIAPSERDQRSPDRTGKLPLVHGFAWTADPSYVAFNTTFHFDDLAAEYPEEIELARRAFGDGKDIRLRDVDITLLIQPEHEDQAARHLDATIAALFFYGLWYGEYPYEHITVVDPAWGARAAGGMEYPTLFTCGTRLFTFEAMHSPEGVTVHEAGHQFWYGLVGNNEFEAAWLDEGLNSFTDSEVLWRRYGWRHRTTDYAGVPFDVVAPTRGPGQGDGVGRLARVLAGEGWSIPWIEVELSPLKASGFVGWWRDQPLLAYTRQRDDPRWHDRVRYLGDPDSDPIDTAGWMYVDRASYGVNSYPRTAAALRTLMGLIGPEAFFRGMRHFAEVWRYGHPYPQDFFDAFVEGSGVDVHEYFEDVFRGTDTVDWSVGVAQRRAPYPRGFFQETPADPFVEVVPGELEKQREEDEDDPFRREAVEQDPEDDRVHEIDVVLRRKGGLILPVDVELRFADGTARTVTWTREAQRAAAWWRPLGRGFESAVELEAVVIDPERKLYLDRDMSNNQWFKDEDDATPLRWAERVFTQYTQALHWYGGIGG